MICFSVQYPTAAALPLPQVWSRLSTISKICISRMQTSISCAVKNAFRRSFCPICAPLSSQVTSGQFPKEPPFSRGNPSSQCAHPPFPGCHQVQSHRALCRRTSRFRVRFPPRTRHLGCYSRRTCILHCRMQFHCLHHFGRAVRCSLRWHHGTLLGTDV